MAKKPTQKELAKLRADYLEKREEILKSKVNTLSVKLFDKVFENYLAVLDQQDGKIVSSDTNINMVKGLDQIYNVFRQSDNIPVVQSFVSDLQGIVPLNQRYFKNIAQQGLRAETAVVKEVVEKRLGIDANGNPVPKGFVDKFIRDDSILKKIRKQTMQAITKGKGFQDFKNELKKTITGVPEEELSGAVQQYYRGYAYDTFQKVDRLSGTLFAKELSLRYFFYQGGTIKTTRPFCEKCNGKIVDSLAFKNLEYKDIKPELRSGLPDGDGQPVWNPMSDLGGFNCRHSIDWVADTVAQQFSNKILNLDIITG